MGQTGSILAQVDGQVSVLARVGDRFISEKEFVQRFELLPAVQRNRKNQLEPAKLDLLYSLVAEKLLALEAQARRLDQDSTVQAELLEMRKLLGRDELYRDEISRKVRVTAQEIDRGLREAERELLISFLFFPKRESAEHVRRRIKSQADFNLVAIDSAMQAVRDTATVIWGEANQSIERAAYALQPNEVSPVVPSGDGFYLLTVSKSRRSSYFTSLSPTAFRQFIVSKLRTREEEARLNEFTSVFFKDKVGSSRASVLTKLATAIVEAFKIRRDFDKILLNGAVLNEVRQKCRESLLDTLAVAGSVHWSLGEVVEKLYSKGFSVERQRMKEIPGILNLQVREWVQQELLAQEALRRELDKRPRVREQLEMWYESFLAAKMKEYIRATTKVSESELWSHLRTRGSHLPVPTVQIRELHTSSLEEMQDAIAELESGKSFQEVVARWSHDPITKQAMGLSAPFQISDRHPIGELAWEMEIGQRHGPMRTPGGYLLFELIDKDSLATRIDSTVAERKEKATQELLRLKRQATMGQFLAQLGAKKGFDIYQDRLMQINVSPVPMMTFRLLGFGGRMFAVPFVDRQVEWVGITPPAGIIIP